MAKIVKTLTVSWQWSGDKYSLRGFNLAVTPAAKNPKEEVVATAFVETKEIKQTYSYKMGNVTLDKDAQYKIWVQAVYENSDSDWVATGGATVSDDGSATIITKTDREIQDVVNMASDNILTRQEKISLRREWQEIVYEFLEIESTAISQGIPSSNAAFSNFKSKGNALGTYLNGGTAWTISSNNKTSFPLWINDSNLGSNTSINGNTYRETFRVYYEAKVKILEEINKYKVNNVQVGGVNLLVGTATAKNTNVNAPTGYITWDPYTTHNKQTLEQLGFKAGDKVTIGFDWSISKNGTNDYVYGNFRVEFKGIKSDGTDNQYLGTIKNPAGTFSSSNTKGRVEATVALDSATIKAHSLRFRIDNSVLNFKVSNLKMERGTKATGWSPALEEMENAYTIILTNEAQVIPTNSNRVPTSSTTYFTDIQVYKGTAQRNDYTIGTINSANGITVSKTSSRVNFAVSTNTALAADGGNFIIPITIDGKTFNKTFSWSCSKQGNTGASGVGISKITEYYAVSSSNTTEPTSWSTTVPAMTATNKYLWNYETITYSNNTTANTSKRVIGVYGDKGNTGATGATGNGISNIVNYYLATSSSSGVTTSTSGWTTSVQAVSASKKYLWNYEVVTYTNGSTSTTTPCIIGAYGDTGATGATGPAGQNAQHVVVTGEQVFKYANNFSGTPTPANITLTATKINTTATGKWQWLNGSTWTDWTSNASTLNATTLSVSPTSGSLNTGKSIRIRYIVGSVYDEITLVKVSDGAKGENGEAGKDAYTVVLTNETHTFPTQNNGNIPTALSTTTQVVAYKGASSVTPTIGNLPSVSGLTLSKSGTTVTVQANTGTSLADSGSFNIPVTVDGKSFTKTFSWSKAKQGNAGATGNAGQDAITIVLSNENHTFPCESNGNIPTALSTTCVVTAYKGGTSVTPTIGSITNPTGMTITKNGATLTIQANTGTSLADSGTVNIPITIDGKTFNKTFTWSKAKKGATGATGPQGAQGNKGDKGDTGQSAKYVIVNGEQVFKYTNNFSGTPTPATITLTATKFNTNESGKWQYKDSSGTWIDWLSGGSVITATTVQVHPTSGILGNAKQMSVRYIVGSVYDEITIVKVSDGSQGPQGSAGKDAYTVILTNESHTFPAENNGSIASDITVTTDVLSYKGASSITPTIGTLPTVNGLTLSKTNNRITIVAKSGTALADSGSFNIPITVDGKSFTKTFSWAKSRKGNTGATGAGAKTVDIIASSQVFKSTDGGKTFLPDTITLTPSLQNVTFSKWQYSTDGGRSWSNVSSGSNGLTVSGNNLQISKSSNLFTSTNTTVVFKVITNDSTIYDTITIVKLYDVTELEVGGRNLLLDTQKMASKWNNANNFTTSTDSNGFTTISHSASGLTANSIKGFYSPKIPINKIGDVNNPIVFSVDLQVENTTNWDVQTPFIYEVYNSSGTRIGWVDVGMSKCVPQTIKNKTWTRVTYKRSDLFTGLATSSGANLATDAHSVGIRLSLFRNGKVWYRKPKFEIGTIATDWTPAPEDVATDIDNAKNEAINSANNILITTIADYYTKEETNSQIDIAKESINLGVSSTYETKANVETKVTSTLNSAKSYADTKKNEAINSASTDATAKANNALNNAKSYADTKKTEAINAASTDAANKVNSAKNELNTAIGKKANSADVYTKTQVYTKDETNSQINIAKDAINLGVSQTYETKANVETKVSTTLNSAKSYADTKKNEAISSASSDATNKANNALNNAKSYADTKKTEAINTASTDATSKVNAAKNELNTKIDNIQVGGRNLIRKADLGQNNSTATYNGATNTWTVNATAGAGGTWGCGLVIKNQNALVPYGKSYVLSFEIKVPKACSWNFDINTFALTGSNWGGNDNDNKSKRTASSKSLVANQWIKCWIKWENTNSNNTNKVDIYDNSNFGVVMKDETSNMTYQIRNVKGELGNMPTEWTPAPEDVDSAINKKANSADVYTKTQVYTKEETNSQIKVAKDEINLGVSNTYETKANVETKVSSTLNSAKSYADTKKNEAISSASSDATNKANNALNNAKSYADTKKTEAINSAASDATSKVNSAKNELNTKIDNIQVGGRNLILNSALKDNSKWQAALIDTTKTYEGCNSLKHTSQYSSYSNFITAKVGETFTISAKTFIEKNTGNLPLIIFEEYNDSSTDRINFQETAVSSEINKWQKYEKTWTVKNSATTRVRVRFYNRQASFNSWTSQPKLERGNKATDWLPAPEDMEENISDVKNSLNSFQNTVNTTFKDGIIEEAEAKAIAQHLKTLDAEKADIDKEYSTIYSNANLTGSAKTNLASAKTSFDSAHSSLKSTINTVISDGRVSSSESASVTSTFNTYNTQLGVYKQRVQEALDNISSGKVDKVEIGGRNLARKGSVVKYNSNASATTVNDANFATDGSATISRTAVVNEGAMIDRYVAYDGGVNYVAAFKMRTTSGTVNSIYFYNGRGHRNSKVYIDGAYKGTMGQDLTFPNDTNYHKVEVRFEAVATDSSTANAQNTQHIIPQPMKGTASAYTIQILNLKIEKGNKATDWSPAPEDVAANIDTAKNEAINSANNTLTTTIANYYTKEQTNSQINIAKEAINLGVSNTYETKTNVETKVTSTLNSAKSYADTKKNEAINSAASDATNKVNSAKNELNTKINNVQIGGRNLALGTGKATGDVSGGNSGSPYSATDLFNGITAIKTNTAWSGRHFNLKAIARRGGFKVGDNLILSVYIKSDQNVTLRVSAHRTTGTGNTSGSSKVYDNFTVTPKWQQVWFPFVADEGSLNREDARIEVNVATNSNYIHWAGWKLEKGTKPTDWAPAPEDTTNDIATAKNEAINAASTDATNKVNSAKNELNTAIGKKANAADVYKKTEVYTKSETDSKITIAKDEINLGVSNTYETKTNVETKVNNAVNNIQIGGVNRLAGTATSKNTNVNVPTSYVTFDPYTTPNKQTLEALGFKAGDKVTISFDWSISQNGSNAYTYGNFRLEFKGINSEGTDNQFVGLIKNPVATFSSSNKKGTEAITTTLNSTSIKAHTLRFRIDNSVLNFKVSNVKLEKGNKSTTWSPAPEDVAKDIANAKTDAINTASSDATNKVNSAKNELNTAINKKANSADVYTKTEVYTKAQTDSQIKVAKDEINLGVSNTYETKTNVESKISTAVNNVQIGGRNLQKNTDFKTNLTSWTVGTGYARDTSKLFENTNTVKFTRTGLTADSVSYLYSGTKAIPIEVGQTVTASANFYTDNTSGIDGGKAFIGIWFYNSSGGSIGSSRINIPFVNGKWVKCSHTATAPANTVYTAIVFGTNRNGTYYIAKPMFEKGTKPSDWAPAPEDTITDIANAKNEAINTASNDATNKVNSAKSALNTEINKKANSVDVYKKTEVYTKNETNSQITAAKDSITQTVSNTYETKTNVVNKINAIQVGSRNWVQNSAFESTTGWVTSSGWSVNSSEKFRNNNSMYISRSGLTSDSWSELRSNKIDVKQGDKLVGSWYIKHRDCDMNSIVELWGYKADGSGRVSVANSYQLSGTNANWTRYILKGTVPANVDYVQLAISHRRNGIIYAAMPQVEYGNTATDWSPAPEDIENEITILESETKTLKESVSSLQLNSDSINASVKSLQETVTNTTNGLASDISSIQNQVNLAMTANDVKLEIQKEMAKGTNKVTTATGFTFNESGLNISKSDSEMSTRITEDGMKVYRNNDVVLTANNQGVDAKNLHATTYLIIGGNSRVESITEDGAKRTAVFWIGS